MKIRGLRVPGKSGLLANGPSASLHIRVSVDLYKLIKRKARGKMSISRFVELALQQHLDVLEDQTDES